MKMQVPVEQLRIGMYVEDLDRPWIETPFLFQGFIVDSEERLAELRQYCAFVYVSTAPEASTEAVRRQGVRLSLADDADAKPVYKPVLHEVAHRERVPIESELPVAHRIRRDFKQVLGRMFNEARAGRGFDTGYAISVIGELTDSVLGNPDANILLSQLKRRDDYAASHSMNVSTMSLAFGRHLGLKRESLLDLGFGAMLIDIGNITIPAEILTKKGRLDDAELALVRSHPVAGMEVIRRSGTAVSETALEIVYTHHERMDGSGYPRGLQGDEIPLFGRIVGIVDVYDASTSDRVYRSGNSPSDALHGLYNDRTGLFDGELVEQFIKFLGIYPIGSVVRCNTEEIGIVIGQNPERRLRPKLLLVRNADGVPYPEPRIIDLKQFSGASSIEIAGIVQPGDYDFEVADYIQELCRGDGSAGGEARLSS